MTPIEIKIELIRAGITQEKPMTILLWLIFPIIFLAAMVTLKEIGFIPYVPKSFMGRLANKPACWLATIGTYVAAYFLAIFYIPYLFFKLCYVRLKVFFCFRTARKLRCENAALCLKCGDLVHARDQLVLKKADALLHDKGKRDACENISNQPHMITPVGK